MLFSLIGLTTYADETDISSLDNAVYIENGATISIDANGDAVIPINMKNAVGTTGYQFNVKLPDGINKSDFTFKKSNVRKSEEVSFSGAYQTDGTYKIVAYTSDDNEFSGNDGEIANIIIANATAGNYTFTISKGSITSHGLSYKIEEDIVSTVTIRENSYDEGYAVTFPPFEINTEKESNYFTVSMENMEAVNKVSFDLTFSSTSFYEEYLIESKSLVTGRGTSCTISDKEDGSYSIVASKKFPAGKNDLVEFTVYSENEEGTFTLPQGIYTVTINNIEIDDYKVAPYTANIFVDSPTATPTNGVVKFSGDYSNKEMAEKMLSAIPTDDATVITVDLSGVTALPEGTEITTKNPNALIVTSTNLGLANKENVVIGNTCENLALTDKNDFVTDKKFTAINATYTREMSNKWGTICLPYAVQSNEQIAYYNIVGVENDILILEKYDILPANTPALVQKASGNTIVCEANNVKVGGLISDVTGNVTMKGSFANETMVTDENAYYIANNRFWLNNQYFFVDAFRAYFTVSSSIAKANVFNIDDIVTQIDALTNGNDIIGIWNANGTTRENIDKGMNIIKTSDGRIFKVLVK